MFFAETYIFFLYYMNTTSFDFCSLGDLGIVCFNSSGNSVDLFDNVRG